MKGRLLACLMAATLILAACSQAPAPTPDATPEPTPTPVPVEFALPYYASASLHPILGESRTNLTLASLLYDGLFALDGQFRPQPRLCQSYTVSEDGLTWTFRLKPGIRFSDGTPLAAGHAAASLNLARTSPLYASRLAGVRSVRAVKDGIEVALTSPDGALPSLLDVPIVLEREGTWPLGTGRYALAGEGESLCLERQPAADPALPETIPLATVQGADNLVYAFGTKVISLVTTDLTGTDSLGYSGGYEVWDCPTTAMVYLGFRTDTGPCQDPVLRRAISMALDRESVVDALYSRHARAAALPVSPVSECYDPALAAQLAYAPKEATDLLEEAGYTLSDGRLTRGRSQVKLTLAVNTDNTVRLATAEFLAGELGKLGLAVTVEKLSWEDYTKALQAGTFDLYLAEAILPASFDLATLLGPGGALNYGRWHSAETQTLMIAFQAARGEARKTAASALYTHLLQEAPIAPLCFKEQSVLTQWGQVSGLTPTRADPFYGNGWSVRDG